MHIYSETELLCLATEHDNISNFPIDLEPIGISFGSKSVQSDQKFVFWDQHFYQGGNLIGRRRVYNNSKIFYG